MKIMPNESKTPLLLLEYKPLLVCVDCSYESYIQNEFVRDADKHFCHTCREQYETCCSCGELSNKDDGNYFEDDFYCEHCHADEFSFCSSCENYFPVEEVRVFDNQAYCDNCFFEHCDICDDCGEYMSHDNRCYVDGSDSVYCDNCIDEHQAKVNEFDSQPVRLEGNTFKLITSKRCFGIELEIDVNDLPYKEIEIRTCFGSKYDGSIDEGKEFYSPILQGDIGYLEVKKFCDVVGLHHISSKAGFHLHIDARDMTYKEIRRVWLTYRIIEVYIFLILPHSRRQNSYCKKSQMPIADIKKIKSQADFIRLWRSEKNSNGIRYLGLNLSAYFDHKTIELRYHSGTSDFEKIINWIKLNLAIVDFALKRSVRKICSLESAIQMTESELFLGKEQGSAKIAAIFSYFSDDKGLLTYIEKRYNKFIANVR